MTVKELKQKLEQYPDNMDVFLDERTTEFTYGLLNSISSKKINFKESPDDSEILARETVLILSE
jgi:hypothetical protein